MGVSKNRAYPKMDGLEGKSLLELMIWGYPIFGNTHIDVVAIVNVVDFDLKKKYQDMPVVWEHDPIEIQSEYRPIVLVKIQYY